MAIRSWQDLYTVFTTELQNRRQDLTDLNEGSLIDVLAGCCATAVLEITQVSVDEINKTFFDTANGPEITGDADDLQTLAVDHFGDLFARPQATDAEGTVTFTRLSASAGTVTIPAGTIVKTPQSASGTAQRYSTDTDVIMTGTSINANVTALIAGTDGNAQIGTVTLIESTLTDPTIGVTNLVAFAGGAEEQSDSEYRETIRSLLETLKGATIAAIEAKAKTVSGVSQAVGAEFVIYVKQWDLSANAPVGDYFEISQAKLYICDANGSASDALVSDVQAAINTIRAGGVDVEVDAAAAIVQDWHGSYSLNPTGPNFAILQSDSTMITDLMNSYIQDLDLGANFVRSAANTYILARFGPLGTNDIASFSTIVPTGDISTAANEKLIPGAMEIV